MYEEEIKFSAQMGNGVRKSALWFLPNEHMEEFVRRAHWGSLVKQLALTPVIGMYAFVLCFVAFGYVMNHILFKLIITHIIQGDLAIIGEIVRLFQVMEYSLCEVKCTLCWWREHPLQLTFNMRVVPLPKR